MSAENKDLEQNALASRLGGAWTKFKQGKLISYKMMAILLLLVAGLSLWWYIAADRRKNTSKVWMAFDEASSPAKIDEFVQAHPNTPAARWLEKGKASSQLGAEGIELLANDRSTADQRQKAVENIEKAREAFGKLLDQFKDDPLGKAECLNALVHAEAQLVGVPVSPTQLTEYKGQVPKLIEYLDRLSEAAAPETAWATDSKKYADLLRKDPSEYVRVQRALTSTRGPSFPTGTDPHSPFGGPVPPPPK